ncbi:PIG-L family deacetylase [Pseudactinotalea sp. HY160]|uniref:PIG-L deacetylase family protein n=1 Tax=Pseudactinotalea sp. HY160 TaxID=2654490 RepID=UPI00128D6A9F|nr:PIG-L deacetylase family protein [Pseudactinotalea sp. HY160]MPV51141.1 PIG-L family deacetylase [Pseudactinotalea sp. HY160]
MELQPLDEDWERAVAIVAHPDDMEFGAAGAIARWTAQGKHITYVMVTSGEAGIDSMAPDRAGPLREREQVDSCRIVGVEDVIFLRRPDGTLEHSLELRATLCEQIRRLRPQIVMTNSYRETWPGGLLNQADHIAVGRASVDAVRDAGNRWIFPDAGGGLERWDGVRQIWLPGSPAAGHAVDITATFEVGLDSLRAHAAYIEGLGGFDPAGFLDAGATAAGERLGCRYAATFEVLQP